MRNCFNCSHMYFKQDVFWDNEDVCICGKDNHYVGYPEEAQKEICENWKNKTEDKEDAEMYQERFTEENRKLKLAKHHLDGLVTLFGYRDNTILCANKKRALCAADAVIETMQELKETIENDHGRGDGDYVSPMKVFAMLEKMETKEEMLEFLKMLPRYD